MFSDGKLVQSPQIQKLWNRMHGGNVKFIEGLLKVTATSVRELKLRVIIHNLVDVVASIKEWVNQGYPLPPSISIFTSAVMFFWSSSSYKLPSFEVGLYDNRKIPLHLYPTMPFRKFKFGLSAIPPLMRLSDHGIVGFRT